MRTIKLMADYGCFPLWEASPGLFGNIDPARLGLSEDLQHDLQEWAGRYDDTLNHADPASSGFSTLEEKSRFAEQAKALRRRLAEELGQNFDVIVKIVAEPEK